jgi:hypothetical protein
MALITGRQQQHYPADHDHQKSWPIGLPSKEAQAGPTRLEA